MNLPVVFAIAGFIALLIGLLGGGIKAKELEIPKVTNWARIIFGVTGVILIVLAVKLSGTLDLSATPPIPLVDESTQVSSIASTACFPKDWIVSGNAQWTCDGKTINARGADGNGFLLSQKKYADVFLEAVVNTPNREASFAVHMQDDSNGYLVVLIPEGPSFLQGKLRLLLLKNGLVTLLDEYDSAPFPKVGVPTKLAVQISGNNFTVFLEDKRVISKSDDTFGIGSVGFRVYADTNAPCDSTYKDVNVQG